MKNIVERIENVIVNIEQVKVEFNAKGAEVVELQALLAVADEEVARLEVMVAEKDAEIARLEQLVVPEEDMAALEDVVDRLENAFVEPIE